MVIKIEGDENKYANDLLFTGMGGYQTIWPNTKTSYYATYYSHWLPFPKRYAELNAYDMFPYDLPSEKDPTLKYLSYDKSMELIDWIGLYRQHPEIEMFGKLGIGFLANDSRVLKRKEKLFLNYLRTNALEIRKHYAKYVDILHAYQKGMPIENYLNQKELRDMIKRYGFKELDADKTVAYLQAQGVEWNYFRDYYQAIEELGYALTDTKNIYPKDLKYWHDLAIQNANDLRVERERVKTESEVLKDEKALGGDIRKVFEKYSKVVSFNYNGLKLELPDSVKAIQEEGTLMKHCVFKMGYHRKMAKGEILILFATDEVGNHLETIEYDHNAKQLLQARGLNNNPHERHQEIVDMIHRWEQVAWSV